jgi:hypothetical protein
MCSLSGNQGLQPCVSGNKEIAINGAAQDQNVVRVGNTISQSPYSWQQSFGSFEIDRQHPKVIPDAFEFRSAGSILSQKQFLKNYRIYGKTNPALSLSREQLHCRLLALQVSDDHAAVQKNKRAFTFRNVALLVRLGMRHLLHFLIVGQAGEMPSRKPRAVAWPTSSDPAG